MDISGVDLKPAEGMVALKFVDDLDDDGDLGSDTDVDYDGLLAIVLAVGPKVTGIRKGDTVVTRPYARDGLKIGENAVLADAYCIAATVSK